MPFNFTHSLTWSPQHLHALSCQPTRPSPEDSKANNDIDCWSTVERWTCNIVWCYTIDGPMPNMCISDKCPNPVSTTSFFCNGVYLSMDNSIFDTMEPVYWDWVNLTKNTHISWFALHGLYKIMFILPVMKDHLSWETTKFSDPFIQVSL